MTPADADGSVERNVRESSAAAKRLLEHAGALVEIAGAMTKALREQRKVIAFGNGGSAAHAQHLAAELVGRYRRDRAPLPALALSTNAASLTAIANDFSFDHVFSRQLQAVTQAGDVAIGISTSGSSRNVLAGFEAAKARGAVTVALTGEHGDEAIRAADLGIAFPASETPRIQEGHMLITHILCEIVEDELFPAESP